MELEPAGREDGLVAQSQLERMLAVTESPGELKGLLDKAAAFQELTSRMRVALEEHNRIAEFRIRVARKLGMVLSQTVQRGGSGRKAPGAAQGRGGCSAPLPDGITPAQSSRLQKLARIPDEQFQGYVARCHEHGRALTMAGLLRASAPPRPSSRNGQRRRARSAEPHHPAIRDAAMRCLGPDAAVHAVPRSAAGSRCAGPRAVLRRDLRGECCIVGRRAQCPFGRRNPHRSDRRLRFRVPRALVERSGRGRMALLHGTPPRSGQPVRARRSPCLCDGRVPRPASPRVLCRVP